METTCYFIYSSPTPSVVTRECGARIFRLCCIQVVVGPEQFPPAFFQVVAATFPVVVSGCGIMICSSSAPNETLSLSVAMEVNAAREAPFVVLAPAAERFSVRM